MSSLGTIYINIHVYQSAHTYFLYFASLINLFHLLLFTCVSRDEKKEENVFISSLTHECDSFIHSEQGSSLRSASQSFEPLFIIHQ